MARCAFAIPPQVAARQMPSNLGELKQTSPKFHRISRTPVPRKRVLLICLQTGWFIYLRIRLQELFLRTPRHWFYVCVASLADLLADHRFQETNGSIAPYPPFYSVFIFCLRLNHFLKKQVGDVPKDGKLETIYILYKLASCLKSCGTLMPFV
mgnify:CR=1 FL=1